ncbi:hypothetical protein VB713_27080 [Anabaena cylindrica UHCC 0172]|nr:hypothetical protein [Anabaena cylindrica]MEA5554597.1 hypothetical protein [Anabaena cylindrica UHCC 0172]
MSFQPSQIGSSQIGSSQGNIVHPSFEQDCRTQIGIGQVNRAKHNLSEIGSTEIDPTEINTSVIYRDAIKINPTQVNPTKVSLSSSISLQQFFTSHANTFLLTNIYSTAQTLWQTATPINLNFEVTNLPTGQLAEAVITSYDSLGRPNGGTILIDNDANGLGWFIDPTPWENSEYSTTLTDTAYRATTTVGCVKRSHCVPQGYVHVPQTNLQIKTFFDLDKVLLE